MAKNGVTPANESIDQIRHIIFGDHLEKLERTISQLKKENSELRDRIAQLENRHAAVDQVIEADHQNQKSMESVHQQLQELIEKVKQELDQKLAELDDAKVDKSQIGQAFIEWGTMVKQATTEKS
ncbi:MAG: hypothetical protein MUC94_10365 [bacterium]|jgi:predicted RNase H-like nuclease (RuvC/YqgF family)|nr:hypothetical protein [bacterium]